MRSGSHDRTRFHRADWLVLGLRLLAEAGPEGLTIDRLTALAGKTKGSFYHHFQDQPAFIKALLDHWREAHTGHLIRQVNETPGARARIKTLDRLASELDFAVEIAVRRLAATEPLARQIVEEVDRQRIAYLAELTAAGLGISKESALAVAEVEYAAFVGAQLIFGHKAKSWLRTISERIELRPR
jgi:AcrR family transcriptional regulator